MRASLPLIAISILAMPVALDAQTAQTQSPSVGRAATAPLRDTKIMKDKIPVILQLAASAPYSINGMKTCRAIAAEIGRLNQALGNDVDTPVARKGEGAAVGAAAASAAVNTLIPGLGLVKVITGADKAERRAQAAVFAGAVRRGYLKGVGLQRGCKPPAAPLAAAVADIQELPADDDGKN